MKILHEKPPEWIMSGCLSQFRVNVDNTFWTYGDTIYNPGGKPLPDHIVAHEKQHGRQQEEYMSELKCKTCGHHDVEDGFVTKDADDSLKCPECRAERSESFEFVLGKDAWWREYLSNPRFRMEQEAEAYGEQYRFYCEHQKDRNQRARFLHEISSHFAGPLYQLALTQSQAREMILILSGHKKLAMPSPMQP